ncbi:MAG: putative DNA binding domain-containing protein [Opitutales bacterium]|nr:putative DNA binding domain-containing protein [Opitutales bacterium]
METHRIEYKRELTPDLDLEKEVIAFLNTPEGGLIFIGIDKTGARLGVPDADGDMLKIKDRIKNNITPSAMGLFDVLAEESDGVTCIKIIVASGSEKPYFKKKFGMTEKGCFLRVGTAAEPMPAPLIEKLFASRTRNSIGKIKSHRLEITSAGSLPEGMSRAEFFEGYSIPRNKELMRVFKDLELVEHLGSGIPRITRFYPENCFHFTENFLRMTFPAIEPVYANEEKEVTGEDAGEVTGEDAPQVTTQVTTQVVLKALEDRPLSRAELQKATGLKNREHFRKEYLQPLLRDTLIEPTIPGKPNSRLQKYRLTEKGKAELANQENPDD